MIKKTLLFSAALLTFATFQSCTKCGQCVTETTTGTQTDKTTGVVYCGNDNNESGSYYKQAKLDCEQIPTRYKEQYPTSTAIVTSSWVTVK